MPLRPLARLAALYSCAQRPSASAMRALSARGPPAAAMTATTAAASKRRRLLPLEPGHGRAPSSPSGHAAQRALATTPHRTLATAAGAASKSSGPAAAALQSPAAAADNSSPESSWPHVPVLLDEVLAAFAPPAFRPRTYVDGTLGAGGHASAMLRLHGPHRLRLLVGIDVDPTAHALAGPRLARAAAEAAAAAETAAEAAAGKEEGGSTPSPPTVRLLMGNHSDVSRLLEQVPWPEAELGPHPSAAANGNNSNSNSLLGGVDAMLLDLGVSSMQIDDPARGFSFVRDGPLDMRMGRPEEEEGAAASATSPQTTTPTLTAADIVNTWSEAALAELIRDYGEEKMWRRVAARIVRAREEKGPLLTTSQLTAAIGRTAIRSSSGRKSSSSSEIHPATRTFQALRIAVNDELGGLARAIPAAIDALAPGGRLAVISFHSLEDRVVKHAMLRAAGKPTPDDELAMAQAMAASGGGGVGSSAAADREAWRLGREAAAVGRVLTRRPVLPSEAEVARNPRARSAKLRVFEKFGGAGGGGSSSDEAGSSSSPNNKKATHRSKKWRLADEDRD